MAACKNAGCTGRSVRGQWFCYDCYTMWKAGGAEAVDKRITEMQAAGQELEELRGFKQRVFNAVLPPFAGQPVQQSEGRLFDVIYSGAYIVSKLRKEWYNSPDFASQGAPKIGPRARMIRARLMVEWFQGQLDKANKPKPIYVESQRVVMRQPTRSDCVHLVDGCMNKHPSAKVTDEAGPLRLKVAELEGRLAVAQERSTYTVSTGAANLAAAACLIVGALLVYFIK